MKFGCCIQKKEDIQEVSRLGYDFYEYSGSALAAMSETEFEELLELSRRAGIACLGLNSYCAGRPDIVGESFSREETGEYAALLCGRGSRLGIRNIGIGAPAARRLPENYPKELADAQCLEFLRITAAEAEKYGQSLLFEAVHKGMCDYAVYTRDAVKTVEAAGIRNLGIVLDFYHMKMMGEALSAANAALPYVRHTHISSRGEGLWRGFPGPEDVEEYREIFRWLRAGGYEGSMSIEPGEFSSGEAGAALEMLRKLDEERRTEEL